jgi:hypothetical protein
MPFTSRETPLAYLLLPQKGTKGTKDQWQEIISHAKAQRRKGAENAAALLRLCAFA